MGNIIINNNFRKVSNYCVGTVTQRLILYKYVLPVIEKAWGQAHFEAQYPVKAPGTNERCPRRDRIL